MADAGEQGEFIGLELHARAHRSRPTAGELPEISSGHGDTGGHVFKQGNQGLTVGSPAVVIETCRQYLMVANHTGHDSRNTAITPTSMDGPCGTTLPA